MNNIFVLIWLSFPLLVLPGNYEERDHHILYPRSLTRNGFQGRQSEDTKGVSPNTRVFNGYRINQVKRQNYEIKKDVYRRHMNQSQNGTTLTPFAGTPFNTSRNASLHFNSTCNDLFYYGNSSAKFVLAPYIMDPLMRLQISQDGRKVLTSLSNMFRNMSEKDINMISSIVSQRNVYVPPSGGFISLLDRLWATGNGRQLILRMGGVLKSLTSPQISQMLNLISLSPQNTTSISFLNHFLSSQPGHDLVSGIFGRNVSASILKYVSFITQLLANTTPSKFSQIVSHGSRLNTILMENIRTGLNSDTTTEAALGQNCQHSVCKVRQSACCRGKDGMWTCACLSGYLRSVNGRCISAPKKVLEETAHEYWIYPTTHFGTVVATLPLLSFPDVLDRLYVSVDIFPRDSGMAAVVNDSIVSLVLVALPRYKTFMMHITASAGYTYIHQVLPVRISTRVYSDPQTVSTFVLDGTRNGTLVADIMKNTSQDYPYSFEITNTFPGQIPGILFTVSPRGQLLLTRDVDLSLLSGDNFTCSLEAFFKVTAREEGSTRSVIMTKVHVLIIRNSCDYFVEENVRNITVLRNALLPFYQPQFVISISNLSRIFTYGNDSVRLQEYLDFENPHHRHLQFSVRIRTRDGLRKTSISANIYVEDVNDEPPIFMLPVYDFSMIKGSPRGTIIGIVKAKDPDTPEQHLAYSLHGENGRFFRIGRDGAIRVESLNIPKDNFSSTVSSGFNSTVSSGFSLKVSVSDGVNQAVRDSVIMVTLVTATIPQKNLHLDFYLRIPEHSSQGVRVGSIKTTNTSIINYTDFRVLEVQNTLKIDRKTGSISIMKDLDRESGPKVQTFTIMGVERDMNCELVILGTMHVEIVDINDHPPQFDSNSYDVSLLENDRSTIGRYLLSVKVFDPDEGQNGKSQFSLTGQYQDLFYVDTTDGKTAKLFTKTTFDRETIPHLKLHLLAKDGNASGVHTSTSTINIYVLDVNDNAPEFAHKGGANITIRENVDPYCIRNVTATDKDGGFNGEVSFIVAGGKGYFEIGRYNGLLCTTGRIDREVYSTFNLSLEAFDHGKPQLKSLLNISVVVLDENDNPPRFVNPMIASCAENKTCTDPVITMKAVDADTNKRITYKLSNTDFKINNITGVVRCKQPLDFETQRFHTFTVLAFDSGNPARSASTTVVVTVQDANDNKPFFSKSKYVTQFLESHWVANKPVLVLDASDADSGKYGEVTCHINSQNLSQYFRVDGNVVRTVTSHAPSIGNYTFNITATDGGSPPNIARAQVVIRLMSIRSFHYPFNSSRPLPVAKRFPLSEIRFSVIENRNYSTKAIGIVNANGPRKDTFTYALVEKNGSFALNGTTGSLFYRGQFDREKTSLHQLMIRAHLTNGSDYDLVLVSIHVYDVNDNKPRFKPSNNLTIYLNETVPIDTLVSNINATDPDVGPNGNVTYMLSPDTEFRIGARTGALTVARMLDVDSSNSSVRHLRVIARDQGDPPLTSTTTLHIVLMDVNDNAPEFTQARYTFYVKENAEVNEMVTGNISMRAYDRDSHQSTNGHVIYNRTMVAVGGQGTCPFYVSENGDISVSKNIDYEKKRMYTCLATASDMPVDGNSLNSTALVDIFVDDVNDNAPEFKNIPPFVNISRDSPVGTIVTTVAATDSDVDSSNGAIVYSLISTYRKYFSIDALYGNITVQLPLWSLPRVLTLTIVAEDMPQFDAPLNSSAQVVVNIYGNIRARFLKPRYTATVREEADPESNIVQAVARGHPYSQGTVSSQRYVYSLQAGYASDYFHINSVNGMVSQTRPIDREVTGGFLTLYVMVTDGISPTSMDTTVVSVTVDDINDNVPIFTPTQQIQTFAINQLLDITVFHQTASVGSVIGRIASFDPDDPATSSAVYRPIIGNRSISLDSSGMLTVQEPLVKSGVAFYTIQLMVGVSDGSKLQGVSNNYQLTDQSTSALIIINVKQVGNTHYPVFTQDIYGANISSTSRQDQIIPIPGFNATDGDGDNITYSIVSGNVRDIFQIDRVSGVISLQYDLDSTIPTVINLTVAAVDSGSVSKSSTCVVIIRQDGSDFRNCFSSDELNNQIQTEINKVYPFVVGVVAGLMVAAVVVAIVLAVKLRMSRKLLSQLYCTNTVLSSKVDENGRRMRYARSSVDRDYREARPYTSIADLSEIFYIEEGSLSKTGSTLRSHTYSDADPDYESIQNDTCGKYKGHL